VRLDVAGYRFLADRRFGVGADQVLLVEPSTEPDVDFRYRIFNADGHEVEQCGNGSRCFVRFVREQGLTDKRTIRVRTACGIIEPAEQDNGDVRVDMGPPAFTPASVAFDAHGLQTRTEHQATCYALPVYEANERWISVASMGNPHAMQVVADIDDAPVAHEGPMIERHPRFARGVNAAFMQVLDRAHVRLRVWERGVGETLACGTGACAAVVMGIERGLLDSPVQVQALGGVLQIEWQGASVFMTGNAVTVYEGEIDVG
jgi:diaminopimelate epimerase